MFSPRNHTNLGWVLATQRDELWEEGVKHHQMSNSSLEFKAKRSPVPGQPKACGGLASDQSVSDKGREAKGH